MPFHLTSIYARFFGTYSEGTFSQLLDSTTPEDWRCERSQSDSMIGVSLHTGPIVDTWWMDPSRNYMVARHEVTATSPRTNEIRGRVVTEAVEAREIQPGIWLPTRISAIGSSHDRPTPTKTRMIVHEIRVNDPEIDKMFDWQFPQDGTYYDYTLGRSVAPGTMEGRRLASLSRVMQAARSNTGITLLLSGTVLLAVAGVVLAMARAARRRHGKS